jgi:hypothetical protein
LYRQEFLQLNILLMKKIAFLISVLAASVLFAQTPQIGTKAWADLQPQNPNPTVQNGNGVLGTVYDSTACGLNYTQASVKLGQRFSPVGIPQPAPLAIANIPFCAQIDKAYLWCAGSGNGTPITATITNPVGGTANFPMAVVGASVDMCWGYPGTYTYRADVTSIINGNGNYMLSGIDTSSSNSGNDMDGATLMIIYKDITASYTGSIHIDDGCVVINGGVANHSMTAFNSCANSTSANGFMVIANLQGLGAQMTVNAGPPATVVEDWWNYVSIPTSILQSQSSCAFTVNTGGDCFCLSVAGLYTQTSCNTCTPTTGVLTITNPSTTPSSCAANGAATIAITGGSGNYAINWNTNPVQTGLTATNLPAGVYSVTVIDSIAGACGAISITIPYTGPVLTTSTTGVTCNTLGAATVNATGGTAPYTYSWAPMGGTGSTATNLPAGIYTVTVTDNTGCAVTAIDTVQNNSTFGVNIVSIPDSCPSPSGFAQAQVSGGQPPYTYGWLPGGQTTMSVSNLAAGTYTVNVTDASGCLVSGIVTIGTMNNQMNLYLSGQNVVGCGDSTQLFAYTSYSPATFTWSPSTYLNNPNVQNPVATPLGPITYTVTATSACGTATATYYVTSSGQNLHTEPICFVSVDTTINKNIITWERTNSPASGSYYIYRETASAGVYALIGSQPISQFTTYTDMTANPQNYASRYRISTVDSCGIESDSTQHHRTLFLQVSPSIPSGYNLAWSAYEGLTISTYNIYRGPNAGNLVLINAVPGTTLNYTDPNPPSGATYYMVEAVHPSGGCTPSMRLLNTWAMRSGNPSGSVQSTNGSLSNISIVNGVGMDDNSLAGSSLLITPNPGNGNFQLSLSLAHAQLIQVIVYDNLGRNVYSKNENANAGMFNAMMDLSSLSSGVYSVQVRTANGFATKRLVIE